MTMIVFTNIVSFLCCSCYCRGYKYYYEVIQMGNCQNHGPFGKPYLMLRLKRHPIVQEPHKKPDLANPPDEW